MYSEHVVHCYVRVLCTFFVQSKQTLFKLDVQCLTIKCFAMPHTSDAELFSLCVMLNVDGIVQRELWLGLMKIRDVRLHSCEIGHSHNSSYRLCFAGTWCRIVWHVSEQLLCLLVQDNPRLLRVTSSMHKKMLRLVTANIVCQEGLLSFKIRT